MNDQHEQDRLSTVHIGLAIFFGQTERISARDNGGSKAQYDRDRQTQEDTNRRINIERLRAS